MEHAPVPAQFQLETWILWAHVAWHGLRAAAARAADHEALPLRPVVAQQLAPLDPPEAALTKVVPSPPILIEDEPGKALSHCVASRFLRQQALSGFVDPSVPRGELDEVWAEVDVTLFRIDV